jgi:AcrR family transcriptional regulator
VRSQWLRAGLEALRNGGVGAVRVERLAGGVGVTKGSFYHHFRDRGALLDALLEYWSREMTDAEFERIQNLRGGLAQRLVALAEDVLEKGMGRYDPAIRAWGRHDRKVAAAVAQVDRRRVRALTGLFEEAGFGAAEARSRARLFYTFLLGEPQVRAPAREPGELERMVRVFSE